MDVGSGGELEATDVLVGIIEGRGPIQPFRNLLGAPLSFGGIVWVVCDDMASIHDSVYAGVLLLGGSELDGRLP